MVFGTIVTTSCKKESQGLTSKPSMSVNQAMPLPVGRNVQFQFLNHSGSIYKVVFSGAASYTFYLSPFGKQIVDIKEGSYNIEVLPTGTSTDRRLIALTASEPVLGLRAQFSDVIIKPTGQLTLSIN